MVIQINNILTEIEAFQSKHGLSQTRVGVILTNSGGFVKAVKEGRRPHLSTMRKIKQRMHEYETFSLAEDLETLKTIKSVGWIGMDESGQPFLETGKQIDRTQFNRLVSSGLLKPNGDSMFGVNSQTYTLNVSR